MKVLMLVHGLAVGGTEYVVYNLARFLRQSGVEVDVGCLDVVGALGDDLRRQGFRIVCYDRKPGLDLSLPLRIAADARRSSVDVVHAHQVTCYVYGALAKLLTGKPLVFTEHGRFHPDTATPRRRLFNRLFSRLVDRTTAVSGSVRESLASVERFDPRSIEVVTNAVDIDRFSNDVPSAAARDRIGLRAAAAVVGTIGRLCPEKNYPLLIRAVSLVRKEIPELFLVVVGDGPDREALRGLATEVGLSDRVLFLGERNDVERILPAFDVFALSSSAEGVPMTILEAMAASKAIVSTAVGGIPEVLTDGRDARLVPMVGPDPSGPEMVAAFSGALRELLGDQTLRASLGAKALDRARRDFSFASVFGRYRSMYAEVVAR